MIIYKITNKINNKCYIGQTINSLNDRFNRHKKDAISNRLDTHLARAIRKYGEENFIAEIIEEVDNQILLTEREYYWINFYDSVNKGYNETNNKLKCGGNTYSNKRTGAGPCRPKTGSPARSPNTGTGCGCGICQIYIPDGSAT